MLINPIWFYLANVCHSLKFLGLIGTLISLFTALIFLFIELDTKMSQKMQIKKCFTIMAMCILAFVLCPSLKTATEMIIASQITEENAETAKEVVDYIIEKIHDAKGE